MASKVGLPENPPGGEMRSILGRQRNRTRHHYRSKALDAGNRRAGARFWAQLVFLSMADRAVAVLVFYRMRKAAQDRRVRITKDVPACGLITSRLKACCLECGKSLTAMTVTLIVEK